MTTTCSNCLQEFELADLQKSAAPDFCSTQFCTKDCELSALAHSDSAQQWLARLDAEIEDLLAARK